jgi:uncharacterized OB-fold protein
VSLAVEICSSCDYVAFPARLWCPHCAGRDLRPAAAAAGVLEQVTTRRRGDTSEVRIGSVRTEFGPVCLARLQGLVSPGAKVQLDVVDGAIVARPVPE